MSNLHSPLSLRAILLADAATCVAMGILLTAASGIVAELTRIPPALLFYAGAVLFPIAAFMAVVATRPAIPAAGVAIVIAGNVLWVAASMGLVAGPWIAPNMLGTGFVVAQALVVALLAWLELTALRGTAAAGRAG